MATYLEICKDVRAQAGIAGDGPTNVTGQTGINADIVRWVDESYNDIQTTHENWNFLFRRISFELQTGFSEYDMTTHDLRVIAYDTFLIQYQAEDKLRLPFVPYSVFKTDSRFLKTEVGKPEYVTERPDGYLEFWKTADRNYNIYIEGFAAPDILDGSTDEPVFHKQYDDLIKAGALMRYAEFYNVPDMYKSANRTYERLMKQLEYSELPKYNIFTKPFV